MERLGTRGTAGSGAAADSARLGLALWTAIVLACAGTGDRVPSTPSATVGLPGPESVRGVVRQVGNLPFARTVVQGEEGAAAVVGPYEPELRRLVGANVRVTGEPATDAGLGPTLRVTSYEIESIDGARPAVGILRREDGQWRLEGAEGALLPLPAVPPELAEAAGGRVWVLTDAAGAVYRYGVLRPPRVEPER